MNMDDWEKMARDIEKYYDCFDGFVIIHGTDTMCYTASALSFMLENLSKPIVLTGAQVKEGGREELEKTYLSLLFFLFSCHCVRQEVMHMETCSVLY